MIGSNLQARSVARRAGRASPIFQYSNIPIPAIGPATSCLLSPLGLDKALMPWMVDVLGRRFDKVRDKGCGIGRRDAVASSSLLFAPGHDDLAGAHEFDDPEVAEHADAGIHLVGRPGDHDDHRGPG